MRVRSIEAVNVFSFAELRLELNPSLTILVGPNGAGKTSVVRLLDILRLAVRAATTADPETRSRLAPYASTRRAGAPIDQYASVGVSVELSEPQEMELLVSYLRAAAVSDLAISRTDEGALARVWATDQITEASMAPLFTGQFRVTMPRDEGEEWHVSYRFEFEDTAYDVCLDSGMGGITVAGDRPSGGSGRTVMDCLRSIPTSAQGETGYALPSLLPKQGSWSASRRGLP